MDNSHNFHPQGTVTKDAANYLGQSVVNDCVLFAFIL